MAQLLRPARPGCRGVTAVYGVPEDSVPCHIRRFASHYRPQRAGCCSSPRSRCKRARGDLIINSAKTVGTTCAWSGVVTRVSCGTSQARSLAWQDGLVSPVQQVCESFCCDGRRLASCVPWQCVHFAKPWFVCNTTTTFFGWNPGNEQLRCSFPLIPGIVQTNSCAVHLQIPG